MSAGVALRELVRLSSIICHQPVGYSTSGEAGQLREYSDTARLDEDRVCEFYSRLWHQIYLFSTVHRMAYQGVFPWGKVKLISHLHLMLKLRIRGATLPFLIRLHAVVLNQARIGTILL